MSEREAGSGKPEAGSRRLEGGSFDVAIDRVVREMLDVEQPAGLRGRVLRRIEESLSPSPVASPFRWKILAPLAAAAALILAVLGPWRTQSPAPVVTAPPQIAVVTPPQSGRPPAPKPTATGSSAIAKRPRSGSIPASPARVSTQEPDRVVAAAVYTPAEPAGDEIKPLTPIAPMPALAPIEVTPVSQRIIAPAALAMSSLNPIAEVQIAPLSPPERRN